MAVPQALPQAAPQPVRTHGEQIAGYAQNQQASLYDDIPILVHANEQKALKSEVGGCITSGSTWSAPLRQPDTPQTIFCTRASLFV